MYTGNRLLAIYYQLFLPILFQIFYLEKFFSIKFINLVKANGKWEWRVDLFDDFYNDIQTSQKWYKYL